MNDLNRLRQIIAQIDYQPLTEGFQFLRKRDSDITLADIQEVREQLPQFREIQLTPIEYEKHLLTLSLNHFSLRRAKEINQIRPRHLRGRLQPVEMQKNIKSITKLTPKNFVNELDVQVNNRPINISRIDLLNFDRSLRVYDNELAKINLQNIDLNNYNSIIHDNTLEVQRSSINVLDLPSFNKEVPVIEHTYKLNTIDELTLDNQTIELPITVPELRYKKVPKEPLEPVLHELSVPDLPFKVDDLVEPMPFNEDVPDYYAELLKMGYEQIDQLEGIPDLRACREFAEFYDEATSDLSGKAKGLFLLQTAKISEIALQLVIWDELDVYNDFLEEWLEINGSDYEGAVLTEDGVRFEGKTFMNLRDKIMVENNGRNAVKMGNDFRETLQNGNSVEKEIYDSFIEFLETR